MSRTASTLVAVTGATGNLGRAVAARFFSEGANLALLARDVSRLQEWVRQMGWPPERFSLHAVDVVSQMEVAAAFDAVIDRWEHVDGVVHTVGGFQGGTIQQTSVDTWDSLFDINAKSAFLVGQDVSRRMISEGRPGWLVFVASRLAHRAVSGAGVYSASKAALLRLTEAMALEWESSRIRVHCFDPGTLDTPQNRTAMPNASFSSWTSLEALASQIIRFSESSN